MEVGTHSRWVSQLLREPGHEVLVANARKLRAVYDNPRKGDRADAQTLARLARLDPAPLPGKRQMEEGEGQTYEESSARAWRPPKWNGAAHASGTDIAPPSCTSPAPGEPSDGLE